MVVFGGRTKVVIALVLIIPGLVMLNMATFGAMVAGTGASLFTSYGGDGDSAPSSLRTAGSAAVAMPTRSATRTPAPPKPIRRQEPLVPMKEPVMPSGTKPGSKSACKFRNCSHKKGPFYYILTSYRNRGASYNRWVRTLLNDLYSDVNQVEPGCVCLAIADYNDLLMGPTIQAALEEWPFDRHILPVSGDFSRAGGFQALLENVVRTDPEHSVMFHMDADMVAYPGLMNRVADRTRRGERAFAPVVWSTNGNPDDWYEGYWRKSGTGMIAYYLSDLNAAGGKIPLSDKVTYGKEDHILTMTLDRKTKIPGFKVWRQCTPELVHVFHTKKTWTDTMDGVHPGKVYGTNPWNASEPWKDPLPPFDLVEELEKRHEMDRRACKMADLGKIYS